MSKRKTKARRFVVGFPTLPDGGGRVWGKLGIGKRGQIYPMDTEGARIAAKHQDAVIYELVPVTLEEAQCANEK